MKNIYKALAEFQQNCPIIHKSTQGYGYSYSDLPTIFGVVIPLLKKYGLGFTQPLSSGKVKTILFHIESGESIESEMEIPQGVSLKGMNDFQVLGSAITYIRRYELSSILGIVTDKDIDVSKEQQKTVVKPELVPSDTLKWKNAFNALRNGKTMEDITRVYSISEENKKKLQDDSI